MTAARSCRARPDRRAGGWRQRCRARRRSGSCSAAAATCRTPPASRRSRARRPPARLRSRSSGLAGASPRAVDQARDFVEALAPALIVRRARALHQRAQEIDGGARLPCRRRPAWRRGRAASRAAPRRRGCGRSDIASPRRRWLRRPPSLGGALFLPRALGGADVAVLRDQQIGGALDQFARFGLADVRQILARRSRPARRRTR